jgi:hypothetical protein
MRRGRTWPWIRMRPFLAQFSEPAWSGHLPSWADFITTALGSRFSVHTAGFSSGSANRKHQITRHPWRTSPPLRPSLSFRYTQASARFQKPSLTPPRDARPSAGASAFRRRVARTVPVLRRSRVRTFCSIVIATSSGVNPASATEIWKRFSWSRSIL